MDRSYYNDTIENFINRNSDEIIGILASKSRFADELNQKSAWREEIKILKEALTSFNGKIYFEYTIPRMGQRIDVLLIIKSTIFIIEFKVGSNEFNTSAIDQVWDYALDLKNFHETSHDKFIAPILLATESDILCIIPSQTNYDDLLFNPIRSNKRILKELIERILELNSNESTIDIDKWESGRYNPTPTIIEAAMALYKGHAVSEISRSDASAINLHETSEAISKIISVSKNNGQKSICFLTGVPGAGKTLVGLNIANKHIDKSSELYSVFLSGNGPLVKILCEALSRDRVKQVREEGGKIRKGDAYREVKSFIQNVHNFRDECIKDMREAPPEHIALFDEAQRAWNLDQTVKFMAQKKNYPGFEMSEPEFLISCLDRHIDWAVIVCLVGGGQEINTGEAGISEWIESLDRSFKNWKIYISPRLTDAEYGAGDTLKQLEGRPNVVYDSNLHLAVSMRSFRAENVSLLVKQILDVEIECLFRTN